MYIYITQQCQDNAEKYYIQPKITELYDNSEVLDLFDPIYPYWKRRIGKYRLLAKIEEVDNEKILCLLNILERKSQEYEEFTDKNKRQKFGQDKLEPLLNDDEIKEWLNEQKESVCQQPNKREPLPNDLLVWLELPSWSKDSQDLVIYESGHWLKKCGQEKIKNRRETFKNIILDIISQNDVEDESTSCSRVKLYSNTEGLSILFSRIETLATEDTSSRKILFLLAPFLEKPSDDPIREVVEAIDPPDFGENVNNLPAQLSMDELTCLARRSYPAYLLLDFESWLAIEKDDESNLALSVEEEQILESISTPQKPSLPMFINGRAGSGKSTMLFHLFADYCDRHWNSCQAGEYDFYQKPHPLFLTYSESLLKVAKDSVQSLLKSHHKFLLDRETPEAETPDVEPFFQPFQKFLLNFLQSTEYDRFKPEKYISYNQFRQLYNDSKLPEARNKRYSAGRCWYIIRTLIKGYSLDGYINEDDYKELPREEQRKIPEETFKGIYKTVWKWYERLIEDKGYWDDQDLIRIVLEGKRFSSEYTAIFCDESQDFTRLELQLIVKLSVFSKYDFGFNYVSVLPFTFAGDPFQTLNPTGFRWDSVGALFYNEVVMRLDPASKLNIKMNFKELQVNYRSSSSIVKVTNLIQLWRCVRFGLPDIKPQTPWDKKDSFSKPQKFIFGQNLSLDDLKSHIDNKPIFILPCEAGGEIDYIKSDEVLLELFPQAKEGKTPENVYSAIKAKGLEFPLVILYKFGHELAQEKYDAKVVWNFDANSQRDSVELEYYFNKLYVAASRAMSDLVVIDSKEGDELLWQQASDDRIDGFLEQLEAGKRHDWTDLLGTISTGQSLEVLDQDNRELQAKQMKKQGLAEENPELLRNAKAYYSVLGDTKEVDLCEAWALKFDNHFSEAGQLFLNLCKKEEAWKCFWEGACWKELKRWCEENPNQKPVERSLVEFMMEEAPKSFDVLNKFTEFLEKRNEDNSLQKFRSSKPWQAAIEQYASQIDIKLMNEQSLTCEQWQRFGNLLQDLHKAGYNKTLEVAGSSFYQAKDYKGAVRCWDLCEVPQKRKYNLAKAEVEGFPEGLQYLQKEGENQQIVQEWERKGKPDKSQWLDYVVPALQNQNGHQELVDYLIQRKLWIKAIEAIAKHPDANEAKSLKFKVVRGIAYSDITPDTARSERQRYQNFITSVRGFSDWQQHLTVQEVGAAMERIGEFVPCLEFYEKFFVDDSNSQLRNFALERWIATKKKQVDYERSTDGGKFKQRQDELDENARKWSINLDSVSDLPELAVPLAETSKTEVKGEADWKTLGPGIEQRDIGRLKVMRIKTMKQLTITDDTSKILQVTLESEKCTVKGKVEDVEVSGSNRLFFKVPESGYTCEVFYSDASPTLELKIQGLSDKIIIKL
ncbi:hypothetical protein [Microcoleus sp. T3_D1]|uniref:hypothetical protein n=1 Tax=Microcoleus sp. T3_D1 TaxID=3055427 RepID=UPI002FD50B5E